MAFNQDFRVKIPTILHLMRLGYTYLSLSNQKWDESTNIFTDVFAINIKRLNPSYQLLTSIELKLVDQSNVRLIDFEYFNNN